MAETINFDVDAIALAPAGWMTGVTGRGTGRWTVERESSAPSPPNVPKQSGSGDFHGWGKRGTALVDGYVEVKFMAVAGREDPAGGIVWRWKDRDNYSVARANALEDDVSLDDTQNGRRIEVDDGHIAGAGAIGIWTKAYRVTLFDDFTFGAASAR